MSVYKQMLGARLCVINQIPERQSLRSDCALGWLGQSSSRVWQTLTHQDGQGEVQRQRILYLRSPTASAKGLWQPEETCSWHCLVAIMVLLTISGFLGWLAAARIEAKHWVLKGDRFKCLGIEKKDKILFNRRTWGSVEKEALSTRHLHIFKILPNKVHNEFNSVPYGPEEFSE